MALHTNKVEETLLESPDLSDGAVQLPNAYHHDVHVRRQRLAWSPFFHNEPRHSQQHPYARREGNERTQPIVVVGFARCNMHTVEDANYESQYDNLSAGLYVKGHIGKSTPLQCVCVIILFSSDGSISELLGFGP